MTFKNIQQFIELGYGNNLPNNKNKFPQWLIIVINLITIATIIIGIIYLFN